MSLLRPCGGSQCPHEFVRTQAVPEGLGFWVVVEMFWVCVPGGSSLAQLSGAYSKAGGTEELNLFDLFHFN